MSNTTLIPTKPAKITGSSVYRHHLVRVAKRTEGFAVLREYNPIAHKLVTLVFEIYPDLYVNPGRSRIHQATRLALRKLTPKERRNKHQVELAKWCIEDSLDDR
jgi:hypothetical protein